jgi:hypothetical protein
VPGRLPGDDADVDAGAADGGHQVPDRHAPQEPLDVAGGAAQRPRCGVPVALGHGRDDGVVGRVGVQRPGVGEPDLGVLITYQLALPEREMAGWWWQWP